MHVIILRSNGREAGKSFYRKQNMIMFSFRKVTRGRVRAALERKKLSTGRPVQVGCCKYPPKRRPVSGHWWSAKKHGQPKRHY